MDILSIFQNKARHLYWHRMASDHVVNGQPESLIDADQAYFVIRMKEMYLAHTRTLWRKSYPMLHGFVSYAGKTEHAVAGPGQLRELSETNLERIINLNMTLAGPIAYKGEDVSILIGLYSVPGQDAAKALISTIGTLSGLGGIAFGQAADIANLVKTGIESIVGLNETSLQLGIRDTFYPGNQLRSGYYLGINAPVTEVNDSRLWLKQGQLVMGVDPIASIPYERYDYMVLEIERRVARDDWPRLPGIAEFQQKISEIMRAPLTAAEKREKLRILWPTFRQALAESEYLTRPDRQQIDISVSTDLQQRLKAEEEGNPFETRAWGDNTVTTRSTSDFDFADVPNYLDVNDVRSLADAANALNRNPFDE